MTRPVFNAAIIEALRKRVTAHNDIVAGQPDLQVKLGAAKKLYKRWHSGADPHAHALAMLDGRLVSLQTKALGDLSKAREPFDPGRHPRGQAGRFSSGGGGDGGDDDQPLVPSGGGDPALLQAAQTQVIPETRYSVLGPKIAGLAGLTASAIGGATASPHLPWHGGGSPIDRVATRILSRVGRGGGKFGGLMAGALAAMPIHAARSAIPAINQRLGTGLGRPRAGTAARTMRQIAEAGGRVGELTGRAAGHGLALTSLPAGLARRQAERAFGGSRLAGHVAGAVVGAVVPGVAVASRLHRWQSKVGPYEDAMRPRRVRKAAGAYWDAPEVLAKQAELLALLDDPEPLQKAVGDAAVRAAMRLLRRPAFLLRRPGAAAAAPAAAGPPSAAAQAAADAFARARPHVTVGRNRQAQALYIAGHGIAGSAAGAGVGGLSGAALAAFGQKHPRDPHGRFRTKAQAALAGAKTGAMIGAGLGVGAGVIAARSGQRNLLAQAIERLRGQKTTTITEGGATKEVNLHDAMREDTERHARAAYAHKFHDEHRPAIPAAAPGVEGDRHIAHISGALEQHAVDSFMRDKGLAMQAGAKAWYRHQLDRAFESEVARQFRRLPAGQREIPRKATGVPLVDAIDEAKLSTDQKKIWDSLLATRNKTAADIEEVYQSRITAATQHGEMLSRMLQEQGDLKATMASIHHQWAGLQQSNPTIEQIRAFAKNTMGYTVRARTNVEGATEEVEKHIPTWLEGADTRLTALGSQISDEQAAQSVASKAIKEGFGPQEALNVINPFSQRKNKVFEPVIGDIPQHLNTLRANASKAFHEGLKNEVEEAHEHLDDMIAATEATLRGRITEPDLFSKLSPKVIAAMAGRAKQAAAETAELAGAHRDALKGTMRDIYDQVHANMDPAKAWASAKKMAMGAADYGAKISLFVRTHHKTLMTLGGLATAAGVIDMTAPRGKRLNMPKRPRDLDVVLEYPDPVKRPGEALYGVSYKDTKNREKFLWGTHVRNKEGTEYTDFSPGAEVDKVRSSLRGGGGSGERDRAGKVNVQNENEVKKAAETIDPHLHDGGPEGFPFRHRSQDQAQGDNASRDVRSGLYRDHINWLVTTNKRLDQIQPDAGRFWRSLAQTFVGEYSQLLTLQQRAGLLFGTEREGKISRGILANPAVYQSKDSSRIAAELTRVINGAGTNLRMRNADDYAQMRRVIWLAGRTRGLGNAEQMHLIREVLNRAWARQHPDNRNPPTSAEPPAAAGASPEHRFEEDFVQILHDFPEGERPDRWQDEEVFREAMRALYDSNRQAHLRTSPEATDQELHRAGMSEVERAVARNRVRNAEAMGELYKLFGLEKQLAEHHRRRMGLPPPIGAMSSQAPPQPASPGAMQPNEFDHRRPPDTPGMAPTQAAPQPTLSSPAHALGQIGTYGLSQAGYDAVSHVMSHFMPAGGMVSGAMRIGLSALGGLAGSQIGQTGGQALGRAIGDRTPQPEQGDNQMAVRQVAGSAAQIGFNSLAPAIGRTAIAGAAQRTISGTVARVLGGAVGTMADPWIGPSGTLIGSTLAGVLTDEGANLLYRHLSGYGEHVSQHALRTMGHHRGSQP